MAGGRPRSVEQFEDEFGWPGDDGPVAEDRHRPLHQLRVGEQHVDHGTAVQAGGVRAQVGVGPDQVAGVAGQSGEEPLEGGPVEGLLQVVDDVELDAALLEDAEGATGLASTGVVVQQQAIRHGDDPRNKPSVRSKWPPTAAGRSQMVYLVASLRCRPV